MAPTVVLTFFVKARRCFFYLQCRGRELVQPPLPSLKMFTILPEGFFVVGMSSYSTSTSLAVFNDMALRKENQVSHLFLVSRVGSRNLHFIRLSMTDFDLILSNSKAGSRSLKPELLLVSAVAGSDRPALQLHRELYKQRLEVQWVLTTSEGFFSGFFFSTYHTKCSGLLIAEFELCPDSSFLQL